MNQWSQGKATVNADDWPLYQLANKKEFTEIDGVREWNLDRTMKRLEYRIEHIIAFSAFVGTILWAFAV